MIVRLANLPRCLIGMETCVGAHHLSRQLQGLGHEARLMPAQYVKPYLRGQKNDFRDAEAIAETVQRPRMRFVPTKSVEQLDLRAMHRVRSRLARHRTSVIIQIRALLLERGIAVRQGVRFLRAALPDILGRYSELLSPRMVQVVAELSGERARCERLAVLAEALLFKPSFIASPGEQGLEVFHATLDIVLSS